MTATIEAGRQLTVDGVLRAVRKRFAEQSRIETPDVDARVLVGGLFDLDATALVLQGGRLVSDADMRRTEAAVKRRLAGEPVYRILGMRPFFGLDLMLSAATLEPRPDTEILVEALRPVAAATASETGACSIADMGTGTGAIALALLSQVPETRAIGVDVSAEALQTAMQNARRLGFAERFGTIESDWFENLTGRFDIIVSNPPYIATEELAGLQREVRRFDPQRALDGGPDGLAPYRILAQGAAGYLTDGGVVGVEHGHKQRMAVNAIFVQAGYRLVSQHDDLAGHPRASIFRFDRTLTRAA